MESLYTGHGPWFLLGRHDGGLEERVHYTDPVALARVVKHVLELSFVIAFVGVDLLAEKVLDYLDLSAAARLLGYGGNGRGRDTLASGPEPPADQRQWRRTK